MRIDWHFDRKDLFGISQLIKEQSSKDVVVQRIRKNVDRVGIDISNRATWRGFVGCLVTTQQSSGKNSKVEQFMASESPVLDLETCFKTKNFAGKASKLLSAAGLRRNLVIGQQLEAALPAFSRSNWTKINNSLKTILESSTLASEREISRMFQSKFSGLGPKQSRNLIQTLGLSRYIVPIDSRFAKHLKEISFPIPVSSLALQDETYYCFVEDGIQRLADALGIYPCVYDASVFASFG